MTDVEKQYYEKCKDLKPIDTGNSLHVYSEDYEIEDKIVTLLWAIGDHGEPMVEIKDKNAKSISQLLDEAFKAKEEIRKAKEKEEILNTFKWIKLKGYRPPERDQNYPAEDWKYEYFELLKHHKEETEFLIEKIRELVKKEEETYVKD